MTAAKGQRPRAITVDDALPAATVDQLRAAIAASRLVGDSQLVGGFAATRGFGIACHRKALPTAMERAPFLAPFVDRALDETVLRALCGAPGPLARMRGTAITALYLNVLVVPPGAAVARHVDATLGPGDPARARIPRAVCVLYLDVPAAVATGSGGGQLQLWDGPGDTPTETITPRAGRMVWFQGHLGHAVTAVQADAPRTSIVAELYGLTPWQLRQVPRLRVQSHGFAEVLAAVRARSGDAASPLERADGGHGHGGSDGDDNS